MKKFHIGLLPRILIAIVLGILCGLFFPQGLVRGFATFNSIFSNLLGFFIPIIIIGLVTPAIALTWSPNCSACRRISRRCRWANC